MTLTAEDLMAYLTATPGTDVAVAEKTAADAADLDAYYAEDAAYEEQMLKADEHAAYYEPGYSAVSGHEREGEVDYNDPRIYEVEVTYSGVVLDKIYGKSGWYRVDYMEQCEAVEKWAAENDAHIFVWEGASWGSGAMTMCAVRNAVANGKSKVIMEGLS